MIGSGISQAPLAPPFLTYREGLVRRRAFDVGRSLAVAGVPKANRPIAQFWSVNSDV